MKWFRNIKAGQPFSDKAISLDYSLQLAVGIQNYYEWQELVRTKGGAINVSPPKAEFRDKQPAVMELFRYSRSGDE